MRAFLHTECNTLSNLREKIKRLEKNYYYTGRDLGAVWTKDKTTFKVWAPLADSVFLRLYKTGDVEDKDALETLLMKEEEAGVYELTIDDDLHGIYYTYLVERDGETVEACDPYARAVGVNGERAMVIDLESTNPEGWEEDMNPHVVDEITDAVIYEGHIRDLTCAPESGIFAKGKYLGLAEEDTVTFHGATSGVNHMKELGITHLHILPMYDFASLDEKSDEVGYNWGYDPKNYNAPEGTYATDAYDAAARIAELKQLIKTLHDNKISVVMDVVYNHVADAAEFSFNKIVPGYFSRTDKKGGPSKGSGCGNDTASERPMVSKFIVDSVLYWATEYHIDGFRFDLAGLIDANTINEAINRVKNVRPDVIFYGEGWDMPTHTDRKVALAVQKNSDSMPEFAFFNDTVRDLLRGSVFDKKKGFVSGNFKGEGKLAKCFTGLYKWCDSPTRTVNYVSCHDNNTLHDRLRIACPEATGDEIASMNKLAAAFVFLSQGVPFIQAGEELMRSKRNPDGSFNENSYNAGDEVNAINYDVVRNEIIYNVYEYYRGLIAFRKAHRMLRLTDRYDVKRTISRLRAGMGKGLLGFKLKDKEEEMLVYFNGSAEQRLIVLPSGEWDIYIDADTASLEPLRTTKAFASIQPLSALVLKRHREAEDR